MHSHNIDVFTIQNTGWCYTIAIHKSHGNFKCLVISSRSKSIGRQSFRNKLHRLRPFNINRLLSHDLGRDILSRNRPDYILGRIHIRQYFIRHRQVNNRDILYRFGSQFVCQLILSELDAHPDSIRIRFDFDKFSVDRVSVFIYLRNQEGNIIQ